MLQRVKKQYIKTDTWDQPDPLDYCLALWKDWMSVGGLRTNGRLVAHGLLGARDEHCSDLYETQHSRDVEVAVATDAMIDSLQRVHIWAIYVSCSISTTWRYPNADFAEAASAAKDALRAKLKLNGCTGTFFI